MRVAAGPVREHNTREPAAADDDRLDLAHRANPAATWPISVANGMSSAA
jgi:hypothetical protein